MNAGKALFARITELVTLTSSLFASGISTLMLYAWGVSAMSTSWQLVAGSPP